MAAATAAGVPEPGQFPESGKFPEPGKLSGTAGFYRSGKRTEL